MGEQEEQAGAATAPRPAPGRYARFHMRRGTPAPETGGKGGRNPDRTFTAGYAQAARLIRMAQSPGMSLEEIVAIGEEHRNGRISRERSI